MIERKVYAHMLRFYGPVAYCTHVTQLVNTNTLCCSYIAYVNQHFILDLSIRLDYAHAGPAFTTWHKYVHLWLEWEMQHMLKSMGRLDYHTFRLPYWDWRIEIQRSTGILSDDLFTEKRLGVTRNVSGFPHVFGDIVGDRWDTICWLTFFQICDPNISTGPLQRCPFTGNDPCNSNNPDWPTTQQVNHAMAFNKYDALPYNILSQKNYRSFVDADIGYNITKCRKDRMCLCLPTFDPDCALTSSNGSQMMALKQQMHGAVSMIVGIVCCMLSFFLFRFIPLLGQVMPLHVFHLIREDKWMMWCHHQMILFLFFTISW